MPMLAPTASSCPAMRIGSASRSSNRSAAATAGGSFAPSSSKANSSPPNRARVSLGRMTSAKRTATSCSSWSPASCPRLSFTCLKPSRSSSRTASTSSDRSDRARAWSRRSRKRARFGRPVRLSWKACWVSCSSSRIRSVMSRAFSTTPRICRSARRSVT